MQQQKLHKSKALDLKIRTANHFSKKNNNKNVLVVQSKKGKLFDTIDFENTVSFFDGAYDSYMNRKKSSYNRFGS